MQPAVKIRVSAGAKPILNIPAVQDPAERIALTLGQDFRRQLIPVAGEISGVRLEGFASRPEFTRSSAAQMYLYVNGRFVKDYLLNHAVMTAYRRLIEARRYPAVILGLEIAPGDVDVNVHPAKMEVRFRNPREIYALIVETLGGAIGAGLTPQAGGSATVSRIEEALRRYRVSAGSEKLVFGGSSSRKSEAPALPPLLPPEFVNETERPDERGRFSDLLYIGQTAGTYLIFSGDAGITLVDQHAAHERVLFEKLRRQAQGEKAVGQRLLLPEVVSLPPRDYHFLMESLPILEEAGVEVEPFGGDSIVIKAIPALLSHAEARALILDLCAGQSRSPPGRETREDFHVAGLQGGRQGEPGSDRPGGDGALPGPGCHTPCPHLSARKTACRFPLAL